MRFGDCQKYVSVEVYRPCRGIFHHVNFVINVIFANCLRFMDFFQVARYHHPSHKESYEIKIKRHFRKLKKILKKKVSLIAYYIICVP